jgi:Flp pilus assembly secretin CpaC
MVLASLAVLTTALLGQCVSEMPRPWTPDEQKVIDQSKAREKAGIVVGVGTQKTIAVPEGVHAAAVALPDIAEAKASDAKHLLVVGSDRGRTGVDVTTNAGVTKHLDVTVVSSNTDKCAWEDWLRWLTPDTAHSPHLKMDEDRMHWVGEVDSLADFRRLRDLANDVPGIAFEVKPNAKLIEARVAQLNQDLAKQGMDRFHASWADDHIDLQFDGTASEEELAAAHKLVKAAREDLQ